MIGEITGIERPGGKVVKATLGDDGVWQCEDESIVERLQLFFDPTKEPYTSPAAGRWGYAAVTQAAAFVGGKAELPDVPEGDAGTVY